MTPEFAPGCSSSPGFPPTSDAADALVAEVSRAGGAITAPADERPWGIYSAYFADPDGHPWEVITFDAVKP